MASATTHTRTPPATTNKLDAMQRARVMRYSRKLGAVLGTTPFLLESCGSTVPATLCTASRPNNSHPHIKRHHRQHSGFDESRPSIESLPLPTFSHGASSSKESLLSTTDSTEESNVSFVVATRSRRTPRPLIFLDTVPLSPSRVQATPRLTRSSSIDVPPTPTTPIQANSAEARRRKMARVMRTLGEKVPPELVFQHDDLENHSVPTTPMPRETRSVSRTRSAVKTARRRSASVGSGSKWQRVFDLPAPVFSSGRKAPDDQRWVGEWNRRNIVQVQRELRNLRSR